jgi:3'-phosphoadenosine 5'-phosphosulfate sulfotransferase (PAPS reductase)/FAD synthetase
MAASSYTDIKDSLRHLYLEDPRPWLVGFSGGKDSTMLASLTPLSFDPNLEALDGLPHSSQK